MIVYFGSDFHLAQGVFLLLLEDHPKSFIKEYFKNLRSQDSYFKDHSLLAKRSLPIS